MLRFFEVEVSRLLLKIGKGKFYLEKPEVYFEWLVSIEPLF